MLRIGLKQKKDLNLVNRKNFEGETDLDELKEISLQFPQLPQEIILSQGNTLKKLTSGLTICFYGSKISNFVAFPELILIGQNLWV